MEKEYTAEDAWRFACNMVYNPDSNECIWHDSYRGCVSKLSFEEAVSEFNKWMKQKNRYEIGRGVRNTDGRLGYLFRIYKNSAKVLYFNDNENFEIVHEADISSLEVTDEYNESVKRLSNTV